MSRLLRTSAGISGGVSLLVLLVSVVSASLFLVLNETSGPAGTVVRGRTGGNGAFAEQVSPLPTYFVDQASSDGVTSPDDARLVMVGQLVVDTSGNGTITFTVPSLPPGPYALMVYCPSCAQTSAGRVMLSVAAFTITPGSANTAIGPPASPLPTILGLALAMAVLAGSAFAALRIGLRSN